MKRFKGTFGKRNLVAALRQQQTLACCEPAIAKLARRAVVQTYKKNSHLIIQESDDNRVAFILSGSVDVLIKGQKVATRADGQHVGEMSVIDPSARRSATIVATELTTVAWVEEKDFSRIAAAHSELWRQLAIELADRLRQRGASIRDRNSQPEIFIGSSSESLRIAKSVERILKPEPLSVKLWSRGVFGASEVTIESLEKRLPSTDFAVLILTADDKLKIRNQKKLAPRDNVIFELGLFFGSIGRSRTFMLVEGNQQKLHLPQDLRGVTYIPISTKSKKKNDSLVAAVMQIQERITALGPR